MSDRYGYFAKIFMKRDLVYDRSTRFKDFRADVHVFGWKPAILRLITRKEFHDWVYMGAYGDYSDLLQCPKCGKQSFPTCFAYYPSPMWCEGKKEPDKS